LPLVITHFDKENDHLTEQSLRVFDHCSVTIPSKGGNELYLLPNAILLLRDVLLG
jgi:hypothetical protein